MPSSGVRHRGGRLTRLVGVDGCRGGWVVASADIGRGKRVSCRFDLVADIRPLFDRAKRGELLIAIDVPIGLPECGPRECDLQARRVLGPGQGSRVFPAPCRSALAGCSYEECCALNRAASGKALTKQTFAILPKIRQVDRAISPALQACVREAHPEVSYRLLAGAPLVHKKKSPAGRDERLQILKGHGVRIDSIQERLRLGRSLVAIDDLLDAAVCLLTAERILTGRAQVLGDGAMDARKLRMEIVG